jgi:hypothetical protein
MLGIFLLDTMRYVQFSSFQVPAGGFAKKGTDVAASCSPELGLKMHDTVSPHPS